MKGAHLLVIALLLCSYGAMAGIRKYNVRVYKPVTGDSATSNIPVSDEAGASLSGFASDAGTSFWAHDKQESGTSAYTVCTRVGSVTTTKGASVTALLPYFAQGTACPDDFKLLFTFFAYPNRVDGTDLLHAAWNPLLTVANAKASNYFSYFVGRGTLAAGYETIGSFLFYAFYDGCNAAISPCDANAICTDGFPNVACACKLGYSGKGTKGTCVTVDPCTPTPCDKAAGICTKTGPTTFTPGRRHGAPCRPPAAGHLRLRRRRRGQP